MATNINNMTGAGGRVDYGDPTLGGHYARFVGFAYIGVHERNAYQGEDKDPCGKVILTFELLDDFITVEDGKVLPRWISKIENAFSSANANTTKIYNTLDPSNQYGGDFGELARLTVPCIVTIDPKRDKTTNQVLPGTRIGAIGSAPPGVESPAAQNPSIVFDFDEPDTKSYATLKKWMRKMVHEAQNFAGSACQRISQTVEAAETSAQPASAAAQPQVTNQAGAGQATLPPANTVGVQQPPANTQLPAPPAPVTQVTGQPLPLIQQPVQTIPAAPPGFRYDQATNSFVPDTAPVGAAPTPGSPY